MFLHRANGDYEQRQGLTFAPSSQQSYHLSGRPLHARENGLEWTFEAFVRMIAGCKKWGSGSLSEAQKRNLKKAEDLMKHELWKDTGMRFREACAHGGNTTTGGLVWRFFSDELVPSGKVAGS